MRAKHAAVATAPKIKPVRRWGVALAAATLALAVAAPAAFADNVITDGDGTLPLAANGTLNLGVVCANGGAGTSVLVGINRNGTGTNVFHNSAALTVSVQSASGAGLSAQMYSNQITLPSNWGSLDNNAVSSAVRSDINFNAGATTGSFSGTITYAATGLNINNASITRTGTLTVTATISNTGSCAPKPTDTTPPSVTVSFPAPNAGSNGWFNANDVTPVVGSVTASDASNVSSISCTGGTLGTLSGIGTTTASGQITVSGNGIHNVSCTAQDAVGNPGAAAGSTNTATIKIDTGLPTVTLDTSATESVTGWYSIGGSGTNGIVIDVAASDAIAGTLTPSCTDNGNPLTITSGHATLHDGIHHVHCTATDTAGNTGSADKTFQVDQTAPSVTISTAANADPATGWYNIASSGTNGVVVNVVATDTVAGTLTPSCTDNGNPLTITGGSATLGDGTHVVHCRATDPAGNVGDDDKTYWVDQTLPTINGTISPAANGAGWNNSNVTVSYSCADATSHIAIGACPADDLVSTEGTTTLHRSVTDYAGNTASGTWTINLDKTAPTITGSTDRPANANHWYNAPVTVTFDCSDSLSDIKSCSTQTTLSSDGAGQSVTGTAVDKADNVNHATVSGINIDQTAPQISLLSRTPANGAGWNNTNVVVAFACTDPNGSGVDTFTDPVTVSTEGAGQSVTGTCTDNAGNTATLEVNGINIDKTAPVITASRTPANGHDWNNGSVTVTFTCADSGPSGLATSADAGTVMVSTEGTNQSATSPNDCADVAGNHASPLTVSDINIDETAPIAFPTADRAADRGFWFNHPVSFTTTGSDDRSGIDTCSTAPSSYSGPDNASVTVYGSCTDNAGNNSTLAPLSFGYDGTAPVVSLSGVTDGATYTLGTPNPQCSTTDATSGVQTQAHLQLSGGPLGQVTASCVGGSDNAGNPGNTPSATYTVIYKWAGFFAPVNNTPTLNVAKAGSAIPVKFSLNGNQGLSIMAAGSPSSRAINCSSGASTDAIESTVTAGNSSLQYDATSDQYTYVWKTDKAYAGSCRQLSVTLIDGTTHVANFQFTK